MNRDLILKKIKSTSKDSAEIEEIILRETGITRLIFKPTLVNNPKETEACVRGFFAFKRKTQGGEWEDYKELNLTQLKADEWIKLDLKSKEILKLYDFLTQCYEIYEEYGIPYGEKRVLVIDEFFNNFANVIEGMLKNEELFLIIDKLKFLKTEDIKNLNVIVGIANLKKLLEIWESNKENNDEEFWQNLFKSNYWSISQLFFTPVILFKEKAYIGGKSVDNTGGKIVDFLYQNKITHNISLIEIKTPETKLLGREYRNGIYTISSELSGAINQLLSYKDEIQKNYFNIFKDETSQLINPKCILIIGKLNDLNMNEKGNNSFEIFRRGLKDIEIVTYDELFGKIELFLNLFFKKDNDSEEKNTIEEISDNNLEYPDDIPF